MKSVIILASLGVVLAIPAANADHQTRSQSKFRSWTTSEPRRTYDDRDRNGWYPRDSNQLRFGSQLWWEQMEREGRFGGARRTR